jgi:uncharacterized membrane protein
MISQGFFMSLLQHLHPAVVHFPIALLMVGSVAALWYQYRQPLPALRWTIWFLIATGWLASVAAVVTGLFSQSQLPAGAPFAVVLNLHITAGIGVMLLYGAILYRAWLAAHPRRRNRREPSSAIDLLDRPAARGWLTLAWLAGIALLFLAGWNGGELVYVWGVGRGGS